MKIIQKISYNSANCLKNQLQQNHQKRAEYYFGFQGIYQSIIKVTVLAILALVFGVVKPMLFVVLAFTSLRFFCGGVHLGTYLRCFVFTIITFVPASLLAKNFREDLSTLFILIVFAIAAVLIFRYAPQNSPFNQVSEKKAKLKRLSLAMLSGWLIISACLYIFHQPELVLSILVGIILEVSSITPALEKIYIKIDRIGAKR